MTGTEILALISLLCSFIQTILNIIFMSPIIKQILESRKEKRILRKQRFDYLYDTRFVYIDRATFRTKVRQADGKTYDQILKESSISGVTKINAKGDNNDLLHFVNVYGKLNSDNTITIEFKRINRDIKNINKYTKHYIDYKF